MTYFQSLSPQPPLIKMMAILGVSTFTGAVVWLGKRVIQLSFNEGFLFSFLSLFSIKAAHKIKSIAEKKIHSPLILNTLFGSIAFGVPLFLLHQITPLSLISATYLLVASIGIRVFYKKVTDQNPYI
jgi:hypothetical protein